MIISIDFDQTYTADKDMWDQILEIMKESGHIVYCVTCRSPWDRSGIERIEKILGEDHVFFTSGEAKIDYMQSIGYHVDVWIDDTPATVTGGGSVMYRIIKPKEK